MIDVTYSLVSSFSSREALFLGGHTPIKVEKNYIHAYFFYIYIFILKESKGYSSLL